MGKTQPVGTRTPNAWGLHDMSGNVREWCKDAYTLTHPRVKEAVDPEGTGSFVRVVRGGCWDYGTDSCRSASRYGLGADLWFDNVGFRLVREIP